MGSDWTRATTWHLGFLSASNHRLGSSVGLKAVGFRAAARHRDGAVFPVLPRSCLLPLRNPSAIRCGYLVQLCAEWQFLSNSSKQLHIIVCAVIYKTRYCTV